MLESIWKTRKSILFGLIRYQVKVDMQSMPEKIEKYMETKQIDDDYPVTQYRWVILWVISVYKSKVT